MLIFNQTSNTIFVEEESDNRNGGDISFIPIQPDDTYDVASNWVYRIHTLTRGSAVITPQGEGPVTFGSLGVKAKEGLIIIT